MRIKKSQKVLSALLAAAVASSAIVPVATSAKSYTDPVENVYGEDTYAQRFMSLYQDVVTDGIENGYMSSSSTVDSNSGLGIPYHSVEELCIEAPDYGHETTSEALSYLVWAAAMRDNIVNKAKTDSSFDSTLTSYVNQYGDEVGDLSKAWYTLEATMIPDAKVQSNGSAYFLGGSFSYSGNTADYSDEWQDTLDYPTSASATGTNLKVANPLISVFSNTYSSDGGYYLMNWLADVDDWYGFGAANGSSYNQSRVNGTAFTLTNSFQRGESESCWETIPHACISLQGKNYGVQYNGSYYGMKAFFSFDSQGNCADGYDRSQYSYTNAPDAEDRAIQAVYAANRWGVGDQTVNSKMSGNTSISNLAAKMGDQTRNNMYDKYYQAIGVGEKLSSGQDVTSISWNAGGSGTATTGVHYLMNWYTAWGGSTYDNWVWQIGASHMHEFYQNPLAAYSLTDYSGNDGLSLSSNVGQSTISAAAGITSSAENDFEISLDSQIEFYLWLSSEEGLFAGGATNSVNGRYGSYADNPSGDATFTTADGGKLVYVEEPVYADPGSNHWIGNQVWAAQRLAELYYVVATGQGEDPVILSDGTTLSGCLEYMLDKWVAWFLNYTILGTASGTSTGTHDYDGVETDYTIPDLNTVTDDGISFQIPASVVWNGEPDDWTGSISSNSNLDCLVVGYGNGDIGCISSLANTLIYYAAAKGVVGTDDKMDEYQATYEANRAEVRSSNSNFGASVNNGGDDTITKPNGLYDTTTYLQDHGSTLGEEALYLAKELLDREWESYRDGIGLGVEDCNSNLTRMWEEELVLPSSGTNWKNGRGESYSVDLDDRFSGTMPNGAPIANGVSFYELRSGYEDCEMAQIAYDYYKGNGDDNNGDGTIDVSDYYFTLHRFWHEGDAMMALGAMAEVYPDLTPRNVESSDESEESSEETTEATTEETTEATTEATAEETTEATTEETTGEDLNAEDEPWTEDDTDQAGISKLLGDTDLDGDIDMADVVYLNKYINDSITFTKQQFLNGDCYMQDDTLNINDVMSLMKFQVRMTDLPDMG